RPRDGRAERRPHRARGSARAPRRTRGGARRRPHRGRPAQPRVRAGRVERRGRGAPRARLRRADRGRAPRLASGRQGALAAVRVPGAGSLPREGRLGRGRRRGRTTLDRVNSASQALLWRRALELSPAQFRRIAAWAVGWLILIIATGATVRLTGSGLGCRHWPGCQPGDFFPQNARGYHPYVEFGNRVVASLTVLTTLVCAVASLRTRGLARGVKVLAWIVFAGTLAQAPLGAITIHYDLNPWLVLTHLLVSLAVLGLGVVVLLEALRHLRGSAPALALPARLAGAVLAAAVGVLVVTGTLATAAGPHPGSTAVRRVGSFQPAVALHVRATAAF